MSTFCPTCGSPMCAGAKGGTCPITAAVDGVLARELSRDLSTLVGLAMRELRGKGNPATVVAELKRRMQSK